MAVRTIPRWTPPAIARSDVPLPLRSQRALALGICSDEACPCADHRRVDTSGLAIYGIDEDALSPSEATIAALLLPPGMRVTRWALIRALWPDDLEDEGLRATRQIHLRTQVSRLEDRLAPFGWHVVAVVGRGYRLVPLRGDR